MKAVVAWDTETALIRPARLAPPMTCLTWQMHVTDGDRVTRTLPRIAHALEADAKKNLSNWLAAPEFVLVGQNVPFDLAVICAEWPEFLEPVVAALEADRVTDTKIRQQLLDIAEGCFRGRMGEDQKWIPYNYSLDAMAWRHLGEKLKKDGFRLFYAFFRDVQLDGWVEHAKKLQERARAVLAGGRDAEFELLAQGTSEKDRRELVNADPAECLRYPLEDARATLDVFLAQEEISVEARDEDGIDVLANQWEQTRTAFWTHLASAWGLRTTSVGVAKLALEVEKGARIVEQRLVESKLVRPDGSRDTNAAKAKMLEVCGWHWDEGLGKYEPDGARQEDGTLRLLRLTATGEPSLDSDACKAVEDPVLKDYADLTGLKAVAAKDVPALARATVYPIHTNFGMAETARRTSSNPNVQNWRRLPGVRECFIPRPGKVFCQADYSSLELCTLAQACIDLLGESALGEAINAGLDAHTELASSILGISAEDGRARRKNKDDHDFDNARQTAKVANFGFPGGLGAPKLVLFARKSYGVELGATPEQAIARARRLKAEWLGQWPEMVKYFAHVSSLSGADKRVFIEQLRSKRYRNCETYTAACNSFFQGLGADATGYAGWLVMKACYVDRKSPLFGSRIVNYVHDELIVECARDVAPEAAEELSRLMVEGAQRWIPDVKLGAEPCLMSVWSKEAKTLRDANGRLQVWEPKAA